MAQIETRPIPTDADLGYDMDIVKMFFTATVVWALVGMLVGVIIALQLAWWPANLGLPWTTFGLNPTEQTPGIFRGSEFSLTQGHEPQIN